MYFINLYSKKLYTEQELANQLFGCEVKIDEIFKDLTLHILTENGDLAEIPDVYIPLTEKEYKKADLHSAKLKKIENAEARMTAFYDKFENK